MQVLHWLFGVSQDRTRDNPSNEETDQEAKHEDLILFRHRKAWKKLKRFRFLCRRDIDIAKSGFYSTLNLKRLGSFNRRQHWDIYNMKEAISRGLGIGHKQDSSAHSGNKVLPISEASTSSNDECSTSDKKDKLKGDKTKTLSRMKELLRWAASAKSERGGKFMGRKVLHFRNRATLKTVPDDDQMSTDSPKISFRWDVESCSTTSSVYSAISKVSSLRNDHTMNISSMNSTPPHDTDPCTSRRRGNWITTDSDFVVLEL